MKKTVAILLALLMLCGCALAEETVLFEGDGFSLRCPAEWAVSGRKMPVTFDGESGILVLTANDLGAAYTARDLLDLKIPTIIQNIMAGGDGTVYLDPGSVVLLGTYEMVQTRFTRGGTEYYQYFCPVGELVYQFTMTGSPELIREVLSSFTAY